MTDAFLVVAIPALCVLLIIVPWFITIKAERARNQRQLQSQVDDTEVRLGDRVELHNRPHGADCFPQWLVGEFGPYRDEELERQSVPIHLPTSKEL